MFIFLLNLILTVENNLYVYGNFKKYTFISIKTILTVISKKDTKVK